MINNNILFSQKKPADDNSSYFKLAEKFDLDLSFVPFISIKDVEAREFRLQKINILDYSAVVFTSRNTIDHFFRISQELRISVPESMKYFCLTDIVANYLQKYIIPKKRKIFIGKKNLIDLFDQIRKHAEERYLIVGSQNRKVDFEEFYETENIQYSEATFFTISSNDIADLKLKDFGIIVLFSPADVTSLFDNFPNYKQNKTLIACFGPSTIIRAARSGLTVNITAPTADALSMTEAIELYLKKKIK